MADDRMTCLVHANCQGDPLVELLGRHETFRSTYELHRFVNYTREEVPTSLLARCDLFLFQHLGPKWDGLASEVLLAALPDHARTICIPNFLFTGYWPFWNSDPVINYSDAFLNRLIDQGLSKQEIVHLYLHTDLSRFHDLDALFESSLARERKKEERWDLKMVDTVLERFRSQWLFRSVNHPGRFLCQEVADGVLGLLGMEPLPEHVKQAMPEPFDEFHLPIHPGVAEHHGLSFLVEEQPFNIYGVDTSFVEYVNYYVECRQLGESDFISYLRVRTRKR